MQACPRGGKRFVNHDRRILLAEQDLVDLARAYLLISGALGEPMTALDDPGLTPHALRLIAADLRERAREASDRVEGNRLLRLAVKTGNRAWAAEVGEAHAFGSSSSSDVPETA